MTCVLEWAISPVRLSDLRIWRRRVLELGNADPRPKSRDALQARSFASANRDADLARRYCRQFRRTPRHERRAYAAGHRRTHLLRRLADSGSGQGVERSARQWPAQERRYNIAGAGDRRVQARAAFLGTGPLRV